MLQIPQQLQAAPAKPDASKESAKPASGDEFSRILKSQDGSEGVAETGIPPEMAEQALQQLRDGVPFKEVLEGLREQLEELAAALQTPLSPSVVSEQITKTLELSDEALMARLGLRQPAEGGRELPEQLAEDLEADLDLPEQSRPVLKDLVGGKEPGLEKERFELLGRLQLAERATPGNGTPNPGQSAGLKVLDLSAAFKDTLGNVTGQAKPLAEALPLPQRVGEQGWGQALAQRVMWMVGNKQQTAELKLNPAHLGPLEIKLTMKHDQASVSLLASNAVVKEALEQALPRLRDMFGQQDIQLVQADVGQRQDPRQAEADGRLGGQGGGGAAHADADGEPLDQDLSESPDEVIQRGLGLLDAYA